jgi:type III pantothenate kinase
MRWLLLDAGNTALKWEVVLGDAVQWPGISAPDGAERGKAARWHGAVRMDSPQLDEEIARACSIHSALTGASAPEAVVGCTVASARRVQAIEAAVRAANAPAVRWLGATEHFAHDGFTLHNGYARPGQLGADRWHALVGARSTRARGTIAVISLGTATTMDIVDGEGRFLGGVIAPGLELMRASLPRGTGQLPLADGSYVLHPDNTDDAIRTGILDAQIGLCERRLRRVREQGSGPVQVFVCGGNAPVLLPLLQGSAGLGQVLHEPDLVLRGLWHHARALAAQAIAHPPE